MNTATQPINTRIKKNDDVQVIAGKAKGQRGKILRVDKVKGRVYVQGVNMLTKHQKPQKQGEPGQIIQMEGSIAISNVQLYCPNCKKGVRVHAKIEESGVKNRTCAKCGEIIS